MFNSKLLYDVAAAKGATDAIIAERLNSLDILAKDFIKRLNRDLETTGYNNQILFLSAKEFCELFCLDPLDFGLEYREIINNLNETVQIQAYQFKLFKRWVYNAQYKVFIFIFHNDIEDYLISQKVRR